MATGLHHLSDEILQIIFSFIKRPHWRLSVSLTCKRFLHLNERYLYAHLCHNPPQHSMNSMDSILLPLLKRLYLRNYVKVVTLGPISESDWYSRFVAASYGESETRTVNEILSQELQKIAGTGTIVKLEDGEDPIDTTAHVAKALDFDHTKVALLLCLTPKIEELSALIRECCQDTDSWLLSITLVVKGLSWPNKFSHLRAINLQSANNCFDIDLYYVGIILGLPSLKVVRAQGVREDIPELSLMGWSLTYAEETLATKSNVEVMEFLQTQLTPSGLAPLFRRTKGSLREFRCEFTSVSWRDIIWVWEVSAVLQTARDTLETLEMIGGEEALKTSGDLLFSMKDMTALENLVVTLQWADHRLRNKGSEGFVNPARLLEQWLDQVENQNRPFQPLSRQAAMLACLEEMVSLYKSCMAHDLPPETLADLLPPNLESLVLYDAEESWDPEMDDHRKWLRDLLEAKVGGRLPFLKKIKFSILRGRMDSWPTPGSDDPYPLDHLSPSERARIMWEWASNNVSSLPFADSPFRWHQIEDLWSEAYAADIELEVVSRRDIGMNHPSNRLLYMERPLDTKNLSNSQVVND